MNTLRTRAGHWGAAPADSADTGYHAPINTDAQDESTNGRGFVTLGRVLFGYVLLLVGVVALTGYLIHR